MSSWKALKENQKATSDRRILSLFGDKDRARAFSVQTDDLFFDYSKTNIDQDALDALILLAENGDIPAKRDAMFSGQRINETEGRAVLHTALRNPSTLVEVDGEDISLGIVQTLDRMENFARSIRESEYTDLVNIGIGGSDLGPAMAYLALAPYADGPNCHFVSNVDGAQISDTLAGLDPKTTMIIVASKTFTTIETMTNAETARAWLVKGGGDATRQIAALSSNLEKTAEWGIPVEQVFGFEDWVGGRYSVWGPIGLSLMIAIGPERFRDFLSGGADMDAHFRMAPMIENMPIILALVGIWHHQICGYPTRAVLPYEQRLARLPALRLWLRFFLLGLRLLLLGLRRGLRLVHRFRIGRRFRVGRRLGARFSATASTAESAQATRRSQSTRGFH